MRKQEEVVLIKNTLIDIGLTDEQVKEVIEIYDKSTKSVNQILIAYRGQLLNTICDCQEKIYRLDYLMRKLRK